MTLGMVVSYRMFTNINIEHVLNTATRDLFHSMRWSPWMNLYNPKWKMISPGKSSCIIFICVLYATTYVICSYLVQSTREVRKLKNCVWARLVKRIDGQCPCTPLSVINKYSLLIRCIKIKSPAKFLLNEQYVFVGGNISFLCVLSCSSEEA